MSEKPSRRALLKSAAVLAAGAAAPLALAHEVTVKDLDKELAAPLSPEATKLAEEAIKEFQSASESRRKYKLPENSEPSFVFEVREGSRQSW